MEPERSKYEKIRSQLLSENFLFEDPEFPAKGASIYYSKFTPRIWEWKRPGEICDSPKFMKEGGLRFDLDQHDLGDCWYLSALAALTTRPALFEKVVPKGQSFKRGQYAGIFHFRFWHFGVWEEVVVDDRLPFDTRKKRLCFCHNRDHPDEFWAALAEKAYAKLHGSYEALIGGMSQDALVDLSGAIGETVKLNDKQLNKELLWERMLLSNDLEFGPLLCAGISAPKNSYFESETALHSGLFARHAYSITGVRLVELSEDEPDFNGARRLRLLRIRNPFGEDKEWKLDWADNSSKWNGLSDDLHQFLDLRFEADGEFWMSFKDFLRHFDLLFFAHLTPDSHTKITYPFRGEIQGGEMRRVNLRDAPSWRVEMFEGRWRRKRTSAGRNDFFANPQFRLDLNDFNVEDSPGGVFRRHGSALSIASGSSCGGNNAGYGSTNGNYNGSSGHLDRGNDGINDENASGEELDSLSGDSAALAIGGSCVVYVSLMQKYRRKEKTIQGGNWNTSLYISFAVYEISAASSSSNGPYSTKDLTMLDGASPPLLPSTNDFTFDREIAKTFFLSPGSYVIVPTTYYPNQEGEFLLRVMILDVSHLERIVSADEEEEEEEESATGEETEAMDGLADDEEEISDYFPSPHNDAAAAAADDPSSSASAAAAASRRGPRRNNYSSFSEESSWGIPEFLDELIRKHVGDDEEVDFDELQKILKELLRDKLKVDEPFSKATCIQLLRCFDDTGNQRLKRQGLETLWNRLQIFHDAFRTKDVDGNSFLDSKELPEAFKELRLNVTDRMYALLVRLYARKDGRMDFEAFVSAVISVLIVDKLQGPNMTRMLGHPLFTEGFSPNLHWLEQLEALNLRTEGEVEASSVTSASAAASPFAASPTTTSMTSSMTSSLTTIAFKPIATEEEDDSSFGYESGVTSTSGPDSGRSSPSLESYVRDLLSPNIRGFLSNLVSWESVYRQPSEDL